MFYGKLLPSNICLQKQRNSKLVKLKSQAQAPLWREWDFLTVHFVRISVCFFRMIFSGKDVCIGLSTTPYEALTLMFNWWEKGGGEVENKSCKTLNRLRKLVNSNLEILKFEARFAYAVKF